MFKTKKCFLSICRIAFVLFAAPSFLYAWGESICLYSLHKDADPCGIALNFYPSGYSDGWYWGRTSRHPQYSHEMLSGEFGAAIFYDGIHNNHANWLTDFFSYPDWSPDTNFNKDMTFYYNSDSQQWQSWRVWNNNRNAQSRIYDPNIQITIDYHITDLGTDGNVAIPFYPQGYSGSDVPYVASDRYILFQTYNIKNTTQNNITGVKFYQMLVGLVEYPFGNTTKSSTYSYKKFPGQLKDYHYAITQWNYGDPNYHVDWISFASNVEPTWIENGFYDWSPYSGKPNPPGTHWNIENCNLNGSPAVYNSYGAAGAMGWDLGTLEPNQTKSITLAVMFGCGPIKYAKPYDVDLSITDDVSDCIYPNNDVNFTVSYAANQDINDVNLAVELSPYLILKFDKPFCFFCLRPKNEFLYFFVFSY